MTIQPKVLLCMVLTLWGLWGGDLSAQGSGSSPPHGPLPAGLSCTDCHSMDGWRPLDPERSFDHGVFTGFRLDGLHADLQCVSCHQDLRFSATAPETTTCASCHLDVHQGTLSADCATCHTPVGFSEVSGIRLHQNTTFPLEGAHLQLTCQSCHTTDQGGAFAPPASDCLACHREDFERSQAVDHVTLGFPSDCLTCHSPRSWNDVASFDHTSYSGGFRLVGAHLELQCNGCHLPGGGLRFPTPNGQQDCVGCHQDDYQQEHAGTGYPTQCTDCHTVTTWEGAVADHVILSDGYVLEGAHDALLCTSCHTPGGGRTLFSPTGPGDCVACHQPDYQREHAGTGYPTNCTTCHTVTTWGGAQVDHVAISDGYVLEGAHTELACTNCHTPEGSGTLFNPTGPSDCVACHQATINENMRGPAIPTPA